MNLIYYSLFQQVRNCKLSGLNDLNQGSDYVREQISAYMNSLIDIGVAGFRVDACKHMWPGDLDAIFSGLNNLNSEFPAGSRPMIFQEVIDNGKSKFKYSFNCLTMPNIACVRKNFTSSHIP